MKAPVYDMIHQAEKGWWYRGRSSALRALMVRGKVSPQGNALDYGAGYGAMKEFFSGYTSVDALELYPKARSACVSRGYREVFAEEKELLSSPRTYNCVGAFDVLEHIDDDSGFLTRIATKLNTSGIFVATVPAHQFLFGPYDEDAKHFRRYAKNELQQKLLGAGFDILAISYWNMSLFPVAALLRFFGSKTGGTLSPSPFIDRVLGWVVSCEAFFLRFFPLPMGLSIVVVARKK
jgi:SAM-dependent methyltransferase